MLASTSVAAGCDDKGGDCDVMPWSLKTPTTAGTSACKTAQDDECGEWGEITSYKSYGKADIPEERSPPNEGDDVLTDRATGPCQGNTGFDDFSDSNAGTDPDGAEWYADGTTGSMGTLDNCNSSCSEDCSGNYTIETYNYPASSNCSDYEALYLRLEGGEDPAEPPSPGGGAYPSASDCTAGSGRFVLYPIRQTNYDGDGYRSGVFIPIQKTGTGKMTNRAWVTAADLVSGASGRTLRMVKGTSTTTIDDSDQLVNVSTVSTAITGTHTYNTGIYTGNPYFVVQEYAQGEVDDFQVDLTWSCPGSGGAPVSMPQGWQFKLSDIGCTGYNQTLTLRYATSPNRVYLEQYGNPNYMLVEPTTTVGSDDRAFVFDRWGMTIDATITSWNSSSATVQIDEISSSLGNHCTTGTYNFNAE